MMITVHLSDGRKITKDKNKLHWFTTSRVIRENQYPDMLPEEVPDIMEGCITINLDHVVDMRPAEPYEIEYAKIHGW